MRGLASTVALILVLAGLGAYIYFVDSKRPAGGTAPDAKVFAVESDQIEEIRLTAQGLSSVLVRKDSGWQMTEPAATDADPTESSSLVTNVSSATMGRVVEENATDLAPYGLADPRIRIAFKGKDNTSGELLLGDKTPMQSDLYAMKAGEKKVFLVSSYLETTFDKKPFDLRDKKIVKFERDKVDKVELTRGAESITMTRSGSEWKVEQPVAGRADYSAIEGLLTRLSTAGMATIVDGPASDLSKFGLDKPSATIMLGTGSSQTILEIGRKDGDQPYARDKARPMVFTLDTTLTDDLTKAFDDYRKKDFFELRPFNVQRLKVTRADSGQPRTWEFQKPSGTDGDKWTVTPGGGQAADVDRATGEELANKIAALRASTFVNKPAATGLDKPILMIEASYDEGKFERVRIGRGSGGTAYGQREGEAILGTVDQSAIEAAFKALDDALVPPAPAETKTP